MPAPSSPALSVSLVTYHSDLDLLQRTLDSLVLAGGGLAVQLVVVDNSVDERYARSLADLLERYHDGALTVRLELADTNRGFGAAHNLAASLCSASLHLVLNPDVEIQEDSLRRGVAYLESNPGTVVLAPHVFDGEGDVQYLCKRYPSVRVLGLRAFGPGWLRKRHAARLADYEMRDVCDGQHAAATTLASGCFMLLRRDAFDAVGGFEEAFFLYFEDYDLSLRLAQRGQLLYQPELQIVHHGGFAARKGWRHRWLFIASAVRFFHRHGWRW